jgi:hypothetical protein
MPMDLASDNAGFAPDGGLDDGLDDGLDTVNGRNADQHGGDLRDSQVLELATMAFAEAERMRIERDTWRLIADERAESLERADSALRSVRTALDPAGRSRVVRAIGSGIDQRRAASQARLRRGDRPKWSSIKPQ